MSLRGLMGEKKFETLSRRITQERKKCQRKGERVRLGRISRERSFSSRQGGELERGRYSNESFCMLGRWGRHLSKEKLFEDRVDRKESPISVFLYDRERTDFVGQARTH